MRTLLLALVSLVLLTACDTTLSLKELRMVAPASDPYQAALAEGYKNFAEEKVGEYDWWTSKYFADKGLMAAYGRDIQPENPENWDLPQTRMAEFQDARMQLMLALRANEGAQPIRSAAAVVAYDRWIEAEYKGWDVAKMEVRSEAFFEALGQLQRVQEAPYGAPSSEPPTERPVESTSTILYFPFDSDRLGDSAQAALAQMVHDVLAAGNVTVTINGHADRAGTEQYNLDLSERRARMVEHALEAAGVSPNVLHYFAFGESDPAIRTEDDVREPRNRRVEIFIE